MPTPLYYAHKATGDFLAGYILKTIAFWVHVARVKYDRDWTAQAHAVFQDETGASETQVRRALTLLRQNGFVTSEQRIFGGKSVNHFRLTDDGAAVFAERPGWGEGSKSAPLPKTPGAQICAPKGSKSAPLGGANLRHSLQTHLTVLLTIQLTSVD